jgi:subtilisin family serine protease
MTQYNVALKEGVDYDGFWNDMESDTDGGKLYIPNRAVQYTNERPASLRQCWYLLTDEEAELLRQDDRVYCVEIPPEFRDDIIIAHAATQTGDFTKTTSSAGSFLNWGLIRASNPTNVYGTGTTTVLNYDYTLDGTGVDVVIQDSGIQPDHPEFFDSASVSRVYQIDWAAASGLSFTQNANHYRDYDGHGTHVAGIVAGKTYGWAKNASIYSVKVSGLEGSGDSGTGISTTYAFDCIKNWHNAKAGSRPTVVNMSWGYLTFYNSVTSVTYRGSTFTDANTTGNATYRQSTYGIRNISGAGYGYNYICNTRINSVDVDIQEMLDAGIVVCVAAGNRSFKIDKIGGTDYNNTIVTDTGTKYIHRGSSPHQDDAITVGNVDRTSFSSVLDQKATSSETGPGVDIWAPGTNIMSSCSTTNRFSAQNYYNDSSFRQVNISGTSMASPQVAGVCALILQLNPSYTPAQVKSSLLSKATSTIYNTGLNDDWSDLRSLQSGSNSTVTNTYTVTANGSSNYVINGSSNPTLNLIEGQTYSFSVNASGHPFYIKTTNSIGTGNAYNTGVTNNGTANGTITFVVPYDAPSTLYYNCQYHSSMAGTINVTDVPTNARKFLYADYDSAGITSTTTSTSTSTTSTSTSTTSTTTAAPAPTTTSTSTTSTSTSTSTSTTTLGPTTTTTTQSPIICGEYMISTAKGGFVYWVDCNTGNNASTFVNAGKRRYINSRVFPTFEKSSKISIDVLSTYFISQDIIGF